MSSDGDAGPPGNAPKGPTAKGRTKKAHSCPYCDAVFPKAAKLELHLRTHTGERPYACAHCPMAFSHQAHHARHLRVSHADALQAAVSPAAVSAATATAEDAVQKEAPKPIPAAKPSSKAAPKDEADERSSVAASSVLDGIETLTPTPEHPYPHIITPHGRVKKLHPCPYCHVVFHKAAKLTAHERTHTGERPFACELCPMRFTRPTHLTRHMASHTQAAPTSGLTCPQCGKEFRSKDHLRRHERKYCSKGEHDCQECGAVFTSRHLLTLHLARHERQRRPPTPKSPGSPLAYACEECGEAMDGWAALRQHVADKHGFRCPKCPLSFPTPDKRLSHMQSHRPPTLRCTYAGCGKVYNRQCNLSQHVRTVHLFEREQCPVCGALTVTKASLQRHIRTYHPEHECSNDEAPSSSSAVKVEDQAPAPLVAKPSRPRTPERFEEAAEPKRRRRVPGEQGTYPQAFWSRLLGCPAPTALEGGEELSEGLEDESCAPANTETEDRPSTLSLAKASDPLPASFDGIPPAASNPEDSSAHLLPAPQNPEPEDTGPVAKRPRVADVPCECTLEADGTAGHQVHPTGLEPLAPRGLVLPVA